MIFSSSFGILLLLFAAVSAKFSIDYDNDTFILDGKPFRYVSGSMHYFRSPQGVWRDRLKKMREAGLNAVSTYVEWSQHEKIPGVYDFTGDLDVAKFIKIAEEEGLFTILRPGPYICAERDMGGLPPWLLRNEGIYLRTNDSRYTEPVQKWLEILMAELNPLLNGNGGPIILVQVENEYGSYGANDKGYLDWLKNLFVSLVGDDAVLFTTDGAGDGYLKGGKIPGVYATVDFGSGGNVSELFAAQRRFEPKGPLVNSEYYPGWLVHWGEAVDGTTPERVAKTLKEMLDMKANVNFYMFHGGTNFGFTAGANLGDKYVADITSYDYGAPLTEAGDLTPKYRAIQEVLAQYKEGLITNRPDVAPKGDYGELELYHIASLLSPNTQAIIGKKYAANYPQTFEQLENYYGYVLYQTSLPTRKRKSATMSANVRDRGIIIVDDAPVGLLDRETKVSSYTFHSLPPVLNLAILVENLGRINYGMGNNDTKGLGNVTLSGNLVKNWNMTAFPFDNVDKLEKCGNCVEKGKFRFYRSTFRLEENVEVLDTFVDVSTLAKGLVYVNGHNLGRYWNSRGPQLSLYLPGVWLNPAPQENVVVVFDEETENDSIKIRFSATPIWKKRLKPVNPARSVILV